MNKIRYIHLKEIFAKGPLHIVFLLSLFLFSGNAYPGLGTQKSITQVEARIATNVYKKRTVSFNKFLTDSGSEIHAGSGATITHDVSCQYERLIQIKFNKSSKQRNSFKKIDQISIAQYAPRSAA